LSENRAGRTYAGLFFGHTAWRAAVSFAGHFVLLTKFLGKKPPRSAAPAAFPNPRNGEKKIFQKTGAARFFRSGAGKSGFVRDRPDPKKISRIFFACCPKPLTFPTAKQHSSPTKFHTPCPSPVYNLARGKWVPGRQCTVYGTRSANTVHREPYTVNPLSPGHLFTKPSSAHGSLRNE
jgi:hypothetical protein